MTNTPPLDRPRGRPQPRKWPFSCPGYVWVRFLGEGTFGEVHEVVRNGHRRALKFIWLGGRTGQIEMDSLQMVKGLKGHPHVLEMADSFLCDDCLVIDMQLADSNLLDRLAEALAQGLRGIPVEELLKYVDDVASALDYLNARHHVSERGELFSIQHKDIKPSNLLLKSGRVLIGDLGVLQALERLSTTLLPGFTPAYAPPEFFRRRLSEKSDQFSFALTYCHLRGGRSVACHMGADGRLQKPSHLSMMSDAEWAVVARALSTDPADRWPDCMTFAARLAAAVQEGAAVVTQSDPAEGLWVEPIPGLTVKPGHYELFRVDVARGPWTGPIHLRLEGLPEGVHSDPEVMLRGVDACRLTVRAEPKARAAGKTHTVVLVAQGGAAAARTEFPLQVTADPREQVRAAEAIRRRGGMVKTADDRPARPVVEVTLGPRAQDADLAVLTNLTALERLCLNQCGLNGAGLEFLEGLPALGELHLLSCTKLGKEWMKRLHGLIGLRVLGLVGTEVTDESLRHLPALACLESLDLTGSGRISDDGLRHLEGLSGLTNLKLSSEWTSDAARARLQAALPGLEIAFVRAP